MVNIFYIVVMRFYIPFLLPLLVSCTPGKVTQAPSSKKVLVFSKTAGYHHQSIPAGVKAIQELGRQNNFEVDTTTDSTWFTEPVLKQYAAVVFVSPSGNVFDTAQQADFERYIQAGGGFMGIHAATTVEYNWPWYGKLVGGFFDGHPKPQEATILVKDTSNAATKHLPLQWKRNDEWYNFRNMTDDLTILLTVDETTYTGGKHGAFHPLAWYHNFDGGRAFYTAVGHFPEAYSDPLVLQHILAGIQYAIGYNVKLDYSKARTKRIK